MDSTFPLLFERTRVVARVYEVMRKVGARSYFGIKTQNQRSMPHYFTDLCLIES